MTIDTCKMDVPKNKTNKQKIGTRFQYSVSKHANRSKSIKCKGTIIQSKHASKIEANLVSVKEEFHMIR